MASPAQFTDKSLEEVDPEMSDLLQKEMVNRRKRRACWLCACRASACASACMCISACMCLSACVSACRCACVDGCRCKCVHVGRCRCVCAKKYLTLPSLRPPSDPPMEWVGAHCFGELHHTGRYFFARTHAHVLLLHTRLPCVLRAHVYLCV